MYLKVIFLLIILNLSFNTYAYIDLEELSLTNQDRLIKSIDANNNRMCWVDNMSRLKCLGDNGDSKSLYPQSLGEFKNLALSEKGDSIFACATEIKNDVTKCWNLVTKLAYRVQGLISPQKYYLSGDADGMSCAIQKDLTTKCWSNTPKFSGLKALTGFLSDFEFKNTKILRVHKGLACAVNQNDKFSCWTNQKKYFSRKGQIFRDVADITMSWQGARKSKGEKHHICLVTESETRCLNRKISEFENKTLTFVSKYPPLKVVQTPIRKIFKEKPGYAPYFVKESVVCGVNGDDFECYDSSQKLFFKLESKKNVIDYSFLYFDGQDSFMACFRTSDNKSYCESKGDRSKNKITNEQVDEFKKRYFLLNDYKVKNIEMSKNCVLTPNRTIVCVNFDINLNLTSMYDLPAQEVPRFKSVLVQRNRTCALTIEDKALCWGSVLEQLSFMNYKNNFIREANEEERKELLARSQSKDFYINEKTENCHIEGRDIICYQWRSSSRKTEDDLIIQFDDRPYYIFQHNESVCGVSDSEVKCKKITWVKFYSSEGWYYKETRPFVIINNNKFICNKLQIYGAIKCNGDKNQHYSFFNRSNPYIKTKILFYLPEHIKDYDYFSYDESSNKICSYNKDDFVNQTCWVSDHESDIFEVKSDFNFIFSSTSVKCGIKEVDESNSAFCVHSTASEEDSDFKYYFRSYNVNKPWFISTSGEGFKSNRSYPGWKYDHACLNTEFDLYCGRTNYMNIINHINLSHEYVNFSLQKSKMDLYQVVDAVIKDLPIFYSNLIKIIKNYMITKNLKTNFLLLENYLDAQYTARQKVSDFALKQLTLVLAEVDSDKIRDVVLPQLSLGKPNLNMNEKSLYTRQLLKEDLYLLTQFKVNFIIELLTFYDETFKLNSDQFFINQQKLKDALVSYSLDLDYNQFIKRIKVLSGRIEEDMNSEVFESNLVREMILINFEKIFSEEKK